MYSCNSYSYSNIAYTKSTSDIFNLLTIYITKFEAQKYSISLLG